MEYHKYASPKSWGKLKEEGWEYKEHRDGQYLRFVPEGEESSTYQHSVAYCAYNVMYDGESAKLSWPMFLKKK